jgi:hypothetical protein
VSIAVSSWSISWKIPTDSCTKGFISTLSISMLKKTSSLDFFYIKIAKKNNMLVLFGIGIVCYLHFIQEVLCFIQVSCKPGTWTEFRKDYQYKLSYAFSGATYVLQFWTFWTYANPVVSLITKLPVLRINSDHTRKNLLRQFLHYTMENNSSPSLHTIWTFTLYFERIMLNVVQYAASSSQTGERGDSITYVKI